MNNLLSALQGQTKAVGGGVSALLVGLVARFGFHPKAQTVSAIGVIVTAAVSYLIGHVVVYLAPKNKA